jgi:ATP-dependent Clp protease protease subunit
MMFALRENAEKDTLDIDVLDIIGRGFMFEGVTAKNVLQKLRDSKSKNVNVRINSVGGVVDEAMAIRALLKERAANGTKVNVTVLGGAASAATIVADAGTDVAIGKGAYFMIHEASTIGNGRGTAEDHEKAIERLRIANEGLVDMYVAASAARGKNKTASEFRTAMKRERYFDAAESVEWGLADRVVEEVVKIAACADVSALENAPPALREQYEATIASLAAETVSMAPQKLSAVKPASGAAAAPAMPKHDPDGAIPILQKGLRTLSGHPVTVTMGEGESMPMDQVTPAIHGGKKGRTAMNPSEIKNQYPEAYAAILKEGRDEGVTAGRKEGEASERDRVTAHLTMGESSGDMKTAVAAVMDGSAMTVTMQAKYMSAAMNRRDQATRQGETDAAAAAVSGATPPASQSPEGAGSLLDVFAADLPPKKKAS